MHDSSFFHSPIHSFIHGPPSDNTIARSRVYRSPNTLETPGKEAVYLIISSTDIFTNRNLLSISSLAKKSGKKMTPVLQATLYSVSLSNSIGFTLH